MIDIPEHFKAIPVLSTNVSFWQAAESMAELKEIERIAMIRKGLPPETIQMTLVALNIHQNMLCRALNLAIATVKRRLKDGKPLDSMASERVVRLMQIALLARGLFERDEYAAQWLSTPNDALGGEPPVSLCDTELGGRQVRRILHAIESGSAA